MENKKQTFATAMIKRLALIAVDYYKTGFIVDAKRTWERLMGAADMYAEVFGFDGVSGCNIADSALTEACEHIGVNENAIWYSVVAE